MLKSTIERIPKALQLVPAWLLAGLLCAASSAQPPLTCLRFEPGGHSLLAASQSGIQIRNWPQLALQPALATQVANPHELRFSPNGKLLAVAGGAPASEGTVEIVTWPDGRSLRTLQGHDDTVTAVQWLDDARLASASLDQQIVIWDTSTGTVLRKLTGHSRGINALAYLPEQAMLISAGIDQSLRVWNLETGELLRNLVAHTQSVNQLASSPQENGLPLVASAGDDRTVRFWQPTIGRMVRFVRLPARPLQISWHPSGESLAASCTDGTLYIIDPGTVTVTAQHPVQPGHWLYALERHPVDGKLITGGQTAELTVVDGN